jgi:hypothetical protein
MAGNSSRNKTSDKGKGKATATHPITAPSNNATRQDEQNAAHSMSSLPATTTRSRRSNTQAVDATENLSEEIRDKATAKDHLLSNSLLLQDSGHTVASLADALLRVASMNVTRTVRNSIRAVAILLNANNLEVSSLALAAKVCSKVENMLDIPDRQPPSHNDNAPQINTEKLSDDIT